MRGPARTPARKKPFPQPVADAQARTIVAPVGGWNARDALAAMKPHDAVVLDNLFPKTDKVELRPGREQHVYDLPDDVMSLLAYNGTTPKLFAGTDGGIYDVTAAGDGSGFSVEIAATEGHFEYLQMRTSGGAFLLAVNGVDDLKLYDGTSWADIDGVSTPAITGIATTSLSNICLFKRRIWFIEKASLNAWYLGVNSISGAATAFPFGEIFSKGGSLVAQSTWTLDAGDGLDDYLVTVTDQGQIAVYQGTDPSDAATFALVGVFEVGEPVGKKCFVKLGGELLYVSRYGITPLSKLLTEGMAEAKLSFAISSKIDSVFSDYAVLYGENLGWQPTLFPSKTALLFNVPITEDISSYQLVMNTVTKAWCRFTGWNATAFELFGTELYSAVGRKVFKTWTGTSDDGEPIVGRCQQSYTNLGLQGQKHIELSRPNLIVNGAMNLTLSLLNDFKDNFDSSSVAVGVGATGLAVWDTATWDGAVWSADGSFAQSPWLTIPNNPGYFHSLRLQFSTSTATISWTSTDHAYRKIGIL